MIRGRARSFFSLTQFGSFFLIIGGGSTGFFFLRDGSDGFLLYRDGSA